MTGTITSLAARWRRQHRSRPVRLNLYGGPFDGSVHRTRLELGCGQVAVCVTRTLAGPDGAPVVLEAVYQATETGWTHYDPELTAAHLRGLHG